MSKPRLPKFAVFYLGLGSAETFETEKAALDFATDTAVDDGYDLHVARLSWLAHVAPTEPGAVTTRLDT